MIRTQKFARQWALAAAAVALVSVACEKKADLSSDKGKYSYSVGYQIGRNMKAQEIDIDTVAFAQAVNDVLAGKEGALTEEMMREAMRKAAEKRREKDKADAEKNKAMGVAYLESNKAKEGVQVTATGLQYEVLKKGTGAKPKADDVVEVHYKGELIPEMGGTEFDSSYKRNKPAQFPVKAVIPGWTEALQLMNVGSKVRLVIPPELGYGERGNPTIPGNSVLVFEVELLAVNPKPAKG